MAEVVKRLHTKGEIDRAGELLVPWWELYPKSPIDDRLLGTMYSVIDNWRASHAKPLLTFRMGLTQRAKRVEKGVIIAQRMKRFSSVMNKLMRERDMKLSQMQDMGGCRGIMSNVDAVQRLFELYLGSHTPNMFDSEGSLKCYDYIKKPKNDGYRGIHIVGRYRSRYAINEAWNGQRIEIQLRSRLQHAFATAVETVTTFTRHPLKFGGGPDDWRRFFSLMGSALAQREGTAQVPETPSDPLELSRELKDRANALNVRAKLSGWTSALETMPRRHMAGFKWLMLVLDTDKITINVTGFDDRAKASDALAKLEMKKGVDAVLVWVQSAKDLRAAYPNYYADTRAFLSALDEALKPSA
jgi:hypothetical protein